MMIKYECNLCHGYSDRWQRGEKAEAKAAKIHGVKWAKKTRWLYSVNPPHLTTHQLCEVCLEMFNKIIEESPE